MKLFELTNPPTKLKTIGIFSGRFQPFHPGHAGLFRHVEQNYDIAYIISTNSDKADSPFSFDEKKLIATTMFDISPDKFVQVKNTYAAEEVLGQYDDEQYAAIFHVSEKDMKEQPPEIEGGKPKKPRFVFPDTGKALRKRGPMKGEPTMMQKYPGHDQLEPKGIHTYIQTLPTTKFDGMTGSTEFRAKMIDPDEQVAKETFNKVYGKFDQKIFELIRGRLMNLSEDADNKSADAYRKKCERGEFGYSGWG